MDSECSLGQGPFGLIPFPGPVVGYMQGGVFLPARLVDKLREDHPEPSHIKLIPVRQAPSFGEALPFSDVLFSESQNTPES